MDHKTKSIEKKLLAFLRQYNQQDFKKGLRLHKEKQVEVDGFDDDTNEYRVDVESESNDKLYIM